MVEETTKLIRIDLNQFKLHLYLQPEVELTLHFDSPSRRFYLSVIGLVVHEMKKRGRITAIPLQKHLDVLALLNKTVGGSAGSSNKEHLLPRVYRKWKDALPDLENAPLFKVIGRKKRYDELMDRVYGFSEGEKDSWANLFEYKGSHEHVRLRFSIDRLDTSLDEVIIVYGEDPQLVDMDAWEGFIARLKEKLEGKSEPERADRVLKAPESPLLQPRRWLEALPSRWRWPALYAVIGLVVAAAAVAVWKYTFFAPPVEVASVEKMAFPLPDKPSIAILPFRNLSDDPKQEYFSDGITEEIITALSKTPKLVVIARQSTFTYKGKPAKVQQVAEELGVRYVLDGSVRRSEDEVRITAQLVDAASGHLLWAESYDRKLEDIFAVQDEITKKIITALQVKLTEGEQARIYAKGTDNLEAYLKISKVISHLHDAKPENNALVRQLAEEAIALDPNWPMTYSVLGWTHVFDVFYGTSQTPAESLDRAHELGQKALALDEKLGVAHSLLSVTYTLKKQFEKAIEQGKLAVEFNPNNAQFQASLARLLMNAGRPEESIPLYKKAIRLNPHAHGAPYYNFGYALWMIGQYEEALAAGKQARIRSPNDIFSHMLLAVTYIELDRDEDARASAAEVVRIKPDLTLEWLAKMAPWKNKNDVDRLIGNLRKAGLK
jgi:adenylate cyclase